MRIVKEARRYTLWQNEELLTVQASVTCCNCCGLEGYQSVLCEDSAVSAYHINAVDVLSLYAGCPEVLQHNCFMSSNLLYNFLNIPVE